MKCPFDHPLQPTNNRITDNIACNLCHEIVGNKTLYSCVQNNCTYNTCPQCRTAI
eukprot:gene19395-6627_t